MKTNLKQLTALIVVVLFAWFGWIAYQAYFDLVTLDVRNADLRAVIKKMERQTWEDIFVQKEVAGKITIKVTRQPLADVLNILAEQTSARWTAVYPLYTTGPSLKKFKSVTLEELPAKESGWSAWLARPSGRGFGGPGGIGDVLREDNTLISLQLDKKDVETASLALDRFGKSRVVAEDGTKGVIDLKLSQATMPDAVAQVAKQVDRKWSVFYVLQGGGFGGFGGRRGPGGTNDFAGTNGPPAFDGGGFAGFGGGGPGGGGFGGGGFRGGEQTEEQKAAQEKQFEAVLATLTPAERTVAQETRQKMEAIRQLPPEERRAAMEQLRASPQFAAQQAQMQRQMEARQISALKNSTPEQRVERSQMRLERQKQREQRQANRP